MKKRRNVYKSQKSNFGFKTYFNTFLIIAVVIIFFLFYEKNDDEIYADISLQNVAALRISSDVVFELFDMSEKYNIGFAEMFTYYALENDFFENKVGSDDKIEQNFIINYANIKSKYKLKGVKPYYDIINNIYSEIECFPINLEYKDEYIYGDSWGAERTYGGNRIHMGCDISDRENIRGRIPVVSMTDGIIENIGWNEKGGYRIGVRSDKGIYYYYAHFDRYADGMVKGKSVAAGEIIGYMGDTGYSKTEGTRGNFEVHLHLGIALDTVLSDEEFWINPYPFLRLVERNRETEMTE